jgi:hypothetical protein
MREIEHILLGSASTPDGRIQIAARICNRLTAGLTLTKTPQKPAIAINHTALTLLQKTVRQRHPSARKPRHMRAAARSGFLD